MAQPTVDKGRAGLAERKQNFHRLHERDDSLGQLSYLDSAGKERVRTSPLEIDRIDSGIDFSRSLKFIRARAEQRYFGRVYFHGRPAPHHDLRGRACARTRRRGGRDRPSLSPAGDRAGERRNGGICIRRRLTRPAHHPPGHQPRPPAYELRLATAGTSRAARAGERAPPTQRRSGAIRMGRKSSAPSRRSSCSAGGSSSRSR